MARSRPGWREWARDLDLLDILKEGVALRSPLNLSPGYYSFLPLDFLNAL